MQEIKDFCYKWQAIIPCCTFFCLHVIMCKMACYRSGKSSIQKVVFHKMSPNETLFLESTSKIIKDGERHAALHCVDVLFFKTSTIVLSSNFKSGIFLVKLISLIQHLIQKTYSVDVGH